jgi:Family of unknown function (DUF6959)
MTTEVILLSPPINFAVVQLTSRKFPGVVVQGDTLHSLVNRVNELLGLLRSGDTEEVSAGLEDISDQLTDAMKHYERVCTERGIDLPYSG